MEDKKLDSLERVEKKRKSKLLYLFIFIFILGFASGFYIYTHPEISIFSSTAVAASSLKGYGWQVNIAPEINDNLILTKMTGYEKYLFYNVNAYTIPNAVIIEGDINSTVLTFLRDAYQNPTQGKCNVVKNYLKDDEEFANKTCSELYTELQDLATNGWRTFKNGIESNRISVNGNHVTITLPANKLIDGDTFQLGSHSIVYTFQSTAGNHQVNATTRSTLISHLNMTLITPYDTLRGYWNFESNPSATTTQDFSNYGHTATFFNGATTTSTNCIYDICGSWDGINDYMFVPHTTNLNITGQITVMVWVNAKTMGTTNVYTRKGQSAWSYNLGKGTDDKFGWSLVNTGTATNSTYFGTAEVNKWYHVVGVYNGSDMFLYLNGTLVNSTRFVGVLRTDTDALQIGAVNNSGTIVNIINGSIDEIMIFNTALDAGNISEIYQNTSSRFYPRGEIYYPQTNFTLSAGDNSFNISIQGLNKTLGSNAQLKMGEWRKALGYDESTDSGNLLSYYHADSDFADARGFASGTASGGVTATNEGMYNNSWTFDGINDWINTTKDFDFVNNQLSAFLWYKSPQTTNGVLIGTGSGVDELQIALNPATNIIRMRIDGASSVNLDYTKIADDLWHHLGVTYKSGEYRLYFDGIIVNSSTATGTMDDVVGTLWTIGARDNGGSIGTFYNGSIDELMIFNRTLTLDEARSLYAKGRANWTYSTEQNLSTSPTLYVVNSTSTTNWLPQIILTAGTNNFYTPLIYGNLTYSSQQSKPNILFSYQLPTDITTTNIVASGINISYNITSPLGINESSVIIHHKTNSTSSDTTYWYNGTAVSGYQIGGDNQSNASSTWLFELTDNKVLRGTYALQQEVFEETPHDFITLTGNSNYIKVNLFNVSTSKNYTSLEFMANSSVGAGALRIYYCNSTYSTGNPTSNNNCIQAGSLLATQIFNHTHGYSSQNSITIGESSGLIGGIVVTPESSFLFRGTTGNWFIYNVSNQSRTGQTQTTTNNGGVWSNSLGTVDAHLHQSNNNDVFYYYVCANNSDTYQNGDCSSVRNDTLNLGGIPPSAPVVYYPNSSTIVTSFTNINWTASISPSGFAISYYNVTLINATSGLYYSTINTNTSLLGYYWDATSIPDGMWRINVKATDNESQSATGVSEDFNISIDAVAPSVTIISPENDSTVSTITPVLNVTCDSDTIQANYSINGGANTTFTLNSTTLIVGTGANYVIVTCLDSAGNIGTNRTDFTVSLGAGSLCGVSAASTRLNETTVQLGATSWDTAGSYATYVLSGTCKNQTSNLPFPSWTTISAGVYRAFLTTTEQGTCTISAPACTKSEIGWSAWSNSTGGSSGSSGVCTVNATALQSRSSTRPYGQLCRRGEFS